MCTNAAGSFKCLFESGYAKNGTLCTCSDECDDGTHICHPGPVMCTNPVGSYLHMYIRLC